MKQLKLISKSLLALTLLIGVMVTANAQKDKSNRPSPPAQAKATVDGVDVTVDYSQPAVKDRKVWDNLVPYGKVWRTGANEASWIEVSSDVKVGGKTLPKGKYGLFTIPGEDEWTIIFNETWNQWGAYDYDSEKDVLRITAKPKKSDSFSERFTVDISDDGLVSLKWEDLTVPFDIDK
ncbi:MAG: DUF2911 domain-containing protein [Marinoscillum sp.]